MYLNIVRFEFKNMIKEYQKYAQRFLLNDL